MTALPVAACPTEAELEFDRQVDALVMTGLPERLDLAERCFRASAGAAARPAAAARQPTATGIPFVVVVPDLPVVPVLESVHTVGGAGFTTMERRRPGAASGRCRSCDVPDRRPTCCSTSTRAPDTLNVPPAEVLPRITAAGRSPLTIAEGAGRARLRPGRAAQPQLLLAARIGGARPQPPLHARRRGSRAVVRRLVPRRRGERRCRRGGRASRCPRLDHSEVAPRLYSPRRADVAQLARASACHAEGRGFESIIAFWEVPA